MYVYVACLPRLIKTCREEGGTCYYLSVSPGAFHSAFGFSIFAPELRCKVMRSYFTPATFLIPVISNNLNLCFIDSPYIELAITFHLTKLQTVSFARQKLSRSFVVIGLALAISCDAFRLQHFRPCGSGLLVVASSRQE